MVATSHFLLEHCLVKGGFFQDMIHSGINAYLTLHLAQTLLRDGNKRYFELVQVVAKLATPTGQWPEAIHPHTLGGCMGDGQHAWAAAEWVLMMHHLFLREEGEALILLPGIPPEWLTDGSDLFFGPAFTAFGKISLKVTTRASQKNLTWEAEWTRPPKEIRLQLCGNEPVLCTLTDKGAVEIPCA
jgi:hypothetical protein